MSEMGATCPGWIILTPRPGFEEGIVISQFLLHHNLGKFSCKSYEHYFNQTEMFTSNVRFGYPCPRGRGQAVQDGLSCPHPRPGFESAIVISQFSLYHNLGIFSCKSYEHYFSQTEMFTSNVRFGYPCLRGGGQAVQAGLLKFWAGGGGQDKLPWTACPPIPCKYVTQLNV